MTSASFSAKITSDANLGDYTLPLTVQYWYLSNSLANQPTSDQVQYTPVTVTIPLTITIEPVVQIDVLDAEASGLAVGMEGYINLTIKNTGYEDGTQATVRSCSTVTARSSRPMTASISGTSRGRDCHLPVQGRRLQRCAAADLPGRCGGDLHELGW